MSCISLGISAISFFAHLDTIRPVCLPQYDHDLPGGTQCWISGWGYTQPDDGSVILQMKLNEGL